MRHLPVSFLLGSTLLLTSGCATVTRGTTDTLVIESDPPGAQVTLSNGMSGQTQASFKLSRKTTLVVDIVKAGYEPVKVNVQPQISGAGGAGMAGNVLVGGLIGVAVDAGTGAMNDLKPNPIQVRLVPLAGGTASQSATALDARLQRLAAMRRSGALTETEYRRKRAEILDGL